MEKFRAETFYWIARTLELMARRYDARASVTNKVVPGREVLDILEKINHLKIDCFDIGLVFSAIYCKAIVDQCAKPITCREVAEEIQILQKRITDEMGQALFLHIPSNDAIYFEQAIPILPTAVTDKFPQVIEDAAEAGKCYALSRYTATVFHLMRVMEFAVQKFGKKLGVTLTHEKNWQNVLDEINKAIKTKNQKAAKTKEYAALSAYLYNVKLAWRNEVMHPKATYTPEEARHVLDAVKAFMTELAAII